MSDAKTPLISPFDRGFTLGDGLFETMKVRQNSVWYLERHLARLESGAARLGLAVPSQLREWIRAILEQARDAGEREYVLRITVTRGIAHTHGLAGSTGQEPTVVIAAFPWPHFSPTIYERGLHVHIASARKNERAVTAGLKSTSYLESVLALREGVAAGYDDVILLDTRDYVAEASASNVFAYHDGALITPSYSSGILPGITREIVLQLAEQMGMVVAQREITQAELYRADEIFLTSSLRGITPVRQVDQHSIGLGVPGEKTLALMARYDAATERV